jgi:hypothetical protein
MPSHAAECTNMYPEIELARKQTNSRNSSCSCSFSEILVFIEIANLTPEDLMSRSGERLYEGKISI